MLRAPEGWVCDTEEPLLSLLSLPLGQGVGVGEERYPFPGTTFEKGAYQSDSYRNWVFRNMLEQLGSEGLAQKGARP